MDFSLWFFLNSILFGIGLAMDAFSVSLVRGLVEPEMPAKRKLLIAGTFGIFQMLMPLAGWVTVSFFVRIFSAVEALVPWIAFAVLTLIGVRMIIGGIRGGDGEKGAVNGAAGVIAAAFATSIDALSAGLAMAELDIWRALTETFIIGLVTFFISLLGFFAGRKIGSLIGSRASVFGGAVLVAIGIETLLTGVL